MEEERRREETGTEVAETAKKPDFETLLREDRDYQSAFDKKVKKALQTARAHWEQEQGCARAREQEAAQLQAQLQTQQAELEEQRRQFRRAQLEVAVGSQLQKRGLPAEFAPYLTGADEEESARNLEHFEGLFREGISQAVTGRMRGAGAPREPKRPKSYSREELRALSPGEINAHWAEIQHTLKQN